MRERCAGLEDVVNSPAVLDTPEGGGYDGRVCLEGVPDAPTGTELRQNLEWFRGLIG